MAHRCGSPAEPHLAMMHNQITQLGLIDDDDDVALDDAAFALASVDHPDIGLAPYHAYADDK